MQVLNLLHWCIEVLHLLNFPEFTNVDQLGTGGTACRAVKKARGGRRGGRTGGRGAGDAASGRRNVEDYGMYQLLFGQDEARHAIPNLNEEIPVTQNALMTPEHLFR